MKSRKPHDGSPLMPGAGRPLRVMLDLNTTLNDSVDPEQDLLFGLLKDETIELLRYDQGYCPPEGRFPAGWVGAVPAADRDEVALTHHVRSRPSKDRPVRLTALFGDEVPLAGSLMRESSPYDSMSTEVAEEELRSDALALGIARSIQVDLFITNRPLAYLPRWPSARDVVSRRPSEALALVGLFLRSRGRHIGAATAEHGPRFLMNASKGTLATVRALLPDGWRWLSACSAVTAADETSDLVYLAQSVFQRMQRSLRARDEAFTLMSLPPSQDRGDTAMEAMDTALVALVGAFDGAARVAHRSLGILTEERRANWREQKWRAAVRRHGAADLADFVRPGTEAGDLLAVIATLRNTVHGAALQSSLYSPARGPEQLVFGLPPADVSEVMALLDRHGWRAAWGLTEFAPNRVLAEPDKVLDHLVRQAFPVLNEVLRLTPIERLLPESAPVQLVRPPHEAPFDLPSRRSLRLQYGFSAPIE